MLPFIIILILILFIRLFFRKQTNAFITKYKKRPIRLVFNKPYIYTTRIDTLLSLLLPIIPIIIITVVMLFPF